MMWQLFPEEERERELEHLYDSGIVESLNRNEVLPSSYSQVEVEATGVNKQTTDTLMAGERIIEAIDLSDGERAALREYEEQKARMTVGDAIELQPPPKNPILAAYNLEPEAYVLRVVEKVPSTALQDALLVLPFGKVVSLMEYLDIWAQRVRTSSFKCAAQTLIEIKEWNIALVSRIMFYLLKVHHHQMVANRIMRPALIPLRKHLRAALQRQKEVIGYNLAALQYIHRRGEAERTVRFYDEELLDEEKAREKIAEGKKRKRVNIKA
jgi:U3 small nucleolar RNA-associated protein 12